MLRKLTADLNSQNVRVFHLLEEAERVKLTAAVGEEDGCDAEGSRSDLELNKLLASQ